MAQRRGAVRAMRVKKVGRRRGRYSTAGMSAVCVQPPGEGVWRACGRRCHTYKVGSRPRAQRQTSKKNAPAILARSRAVCVLEWRIEGA